MLLFGKFYTLATAICENKNKFLYNNGKLVFIGVIVITFIGLILFFYYF